MTQDCRIDYTKAKSPKIKIKHLSLSGIGRFRNNYKVITNSAISKYESTHPRDCTFEKFKIHTKII